jgi:hypothetical protein
MFAAPGGKAGNRSEFCEQATVEEKDVVSLRRSTSHTGLANKRTEAQRNGGKATKVSLTEGSCLRTVPGSMALPASRVHAGPIAIPDDPGSNHSPVLDHAVVGTGQGNDTLFKSISNLPFCNQISDPHLFTEPDEVAGDNAGCLTDVAAIQGCNDGEAHGMSRQRLSPSMLARRGTFGSESGLDSKQPSGPKVRNSLRSQAMAKARHDGSALLSTGPVDAQLSRPALLPSQATPFDHVTVGAIGTGEPGPQYQSENALPSSVHPQQHPLHPKYSLSRIESSYPSSSHALFDQCSARNDKLGTHLDRSDSKQHQFSNVPSSDSEDCAALVQYLLMDGVAASHADNRLVSGCLNPGPQGGDLPMDAKMRTRVVPSLVRATRDLVSRRLGEIRGCALVVSDVAAFKVVMCLWLTATFESRSVCLDVFETSNCAGAKSIESFLARVASIAQSWGVLPATRAVLSVLPERLNVESTVADKFYLAPEGLHSSHPKLFGLADVPEGTVGTSPTGLLDQSPLIPISLSLNCAVVALERILQTEVFLSPFLMSVFQSIRVAIRTVRTEPDLYANNRLVVGFEAKPPLIVDEDTEVSMWTAHAMLERFLEQRDAVDRTLEDMSACATIACIDVNVIRTILDVLDVFIEGVRILNSGSGASRRPTGASIAVTIPVIKGLKRALVSRLHDVCETSVLNRVLKRLHSAVDLEFPDLETRNIYAIATVVDPRFKSQVFDSQEAGKAAERALSAACMRICYQPSQTSLGFGKTENSLETVLNCPKSANPAGCDPMGNLLGEAEMIVANAIEMYLSEPVSEFSVDIGEYWRSNSTRWPSLAHVASLYLCMPASTRNVLPTARIPSGRCDGGFLDDSDAKQLLFIRQNLQAGVSVRE